MRYSEIATLPGTPSEAKNVVLDLIAVYQGKNQTEIPLGVVLKTLHRQNFDIDRRLLIDLIKDEPSVERISSNSILLKSDEDETLDVVGKDEQEKSKQKVKQMAKKALKKEIGE